MNPDVATFGEPKHDWSDLKVAYIVSMTDGLQSFVYREIRELRSHGVLVVVLPTRVGRGPYMPPKDWPVDRPTLVRVVGQPDGLRRTDIGRRIPRRDRAHFLGIAPGDQVVDLIGGVRESCRRAMRTFHPSRFPDTRPWRSRAWAWPATSPWRSARRSVWRS